jgi:hypothetical protein
MKSNIYTLSVSLFSMAKDDESVKSSKKTPISLAQEAMKATPDDGLPVSISLPPVNAVMDAVTGEIGKGIMNNIQLKQLQTADLMAERMYLDEQAKVKTLKDPVKSPVSSPLGMFPGFGSPSPSPGGDKASIVKAALEALPEAERSKWLEDNKDWIKSSSPGIGGFNPAPVEQPKKETPLSSTGDIIGTLNSMGSMFYNNLLMGIELQKRMTPSSPDPSQQQQNGTAQAIDLFKIVTTFKDMQDNQTQAHRADMESVQALIRSMHESNLTIQRENQAQLLAIQERAFNDKQAALNEKIEFLQRTPPGQINSISVDQLPALVAKMNAAGMNVTTRNADDMNYDLKVLEFNARQEEMKAQRDIAIAREQSRAALLTGVGSIIGSSVEAAKIKKHSPSQAAQAVSGRFS